MERIYPEIPSEPTQNQQLLEHLASLDIKSLETNLNKLIPRLDHTVAELKMENINRGVTNLLSSVNGLVTNPDITNALAAIRPTLDQYRALGAQVTSRVGPLAVSITNTLAQANQALGQVRGVGENLRMMLAPNAPLPTDLGRALEHLAAAAQSVSSLADFLKEQPNALNAGRQLLNRKP